jgi:hypothetical protein
MAESGETGPIATAGNKHKRGKGEESRTKLDGEPYKKQEVKFMKDLDIFNQNQHEENRQYNRLLFVNYFRQLRKGKNESAEKSLKSIGRIFALSLSALEKAITRLDGSKEEERLAVLLARKQLTEDIQEKWNGMFALLSEWGCKAYSTFSFCPEIEIVGKITKPMDASNFAKSAGWVVTQAGPIRIDCLRPADRSGLPISLLHPAFAKFKSIIAQPLPFESDAAQAMATAWTLCMTMPNHFKVKASRAEAFFTGLGGLFDGRSFNPTSYGSANPDAVLMKPDGSLEIVVELRNEPGSAGDVYMQSACSFDAAAIHQIKDRKGAECAAFVVSVDGGRNVVLQQNTHGNI